MAIPASGTITLEQIQTEFGGANPISLSEYYRGGSYVPNATRNNSIPTSGAISLSNFRSTAKFASVSFQIMGGGGGGGWGNDDSFGSGRAPNGGTSSITVGATTYASVGGGAGGANAAFDRREITRRVGRAAPWGQGAGPWPGGTQGNNNSNGSAAPNFGAGGGGAGGDADGGYDGEGGGGEGGYAGSYTTGSFSVVYGTVLRITIGAGGAGGNGDYDGGAGGGGLCRLTIDGSSVDIGATRDYTVS